MKTKNQIIGTLWKIDNAQIITVIVGMKDLFAMFDVYGEFYEKIRTRITENHIYYLVDRVSAVFTAVVIPVNK